MLKIKNIEPPTKGFFHEIMRMIINKNEGIRCIKKPPIFWINVASTEKTSNAKRDKNKVNNIVRTLGNHSKFFLFFIKKNPLLMLLFITQYRIVFQPILAKQTGPTHSPGDVFAATKKTQRTRRKGGGRRGSVFVLAEVVLDSIWADMTAEYEKLGARCQH